MKKRQLASGITLLLMYSSASAVEYYGSNTLRASEYDVEGAFSNGPYPFEGTMAYDEFALYLEDYQGLYDFNAAEITGVYAADDYRHPQTGVSAERVNFTVQRGTSALPYRAELGDHFAYYSQLSLQQSLKGAQLELQPSTDFGRQSVIVTVGEIEPDWRRLNVGENTVAGVSWLLEKEALGSFALNVVNTRRDAIAALGSLDQSQTVYSLAGETPLLLADYRVSLETEWAHFSGDHAGLLSPQSGQDRSDNAGYVELRGAPLSGRWDIRLRADHFGQDFRPAGAIITPDRRSFQLHGGLRLTDMRIRARALRFKDGYETSNTLTTDTLGLNLSGTFIPGLSSNIDVFSQSLDNQNNTVDQENLTAIANFGHTLRDNLHPRLALFVQDLDDRSAVDADSKTRQAGLHLDHNRYLWGADVFVSPGVIWRELRDTAVESTELQPVLSASLVSARHRLDLQYNRLNQNRPTSQGGIDVDTSQWAFHYSYQHGPHQFGAEVDRFYRDPEQGRSTRAYRASLYWTWQFDGALGAAPQPTASIASQRSASDSQAISLLSLAPGQSLGQVRDILAAERLTQPETQGPYRVYNVPVFYDIIQAQSLVVESRDKVVSASGVVFLFDDRGDPNGMAQTYANTLRRLIRRYGRPTRNIETGEFGPGLAAQMASGAFKRIVEWELPGGVLRFGIPRRLDGTLRMELIYRRVQPETSQSLWGFTQLQR